MGLFNLAQLDQADNSVIEIVHPVTGDPIGKVTVYGQDSPTYREAYKKQIRKIQDHAKRAKAKSMDMDYAEQLEMDKISACVSSVEGLEVNGSPVTKENVKEVFSSYRWIYDQVSEAIVDRRNFMKG